MAPVTIKICVDPKLNFGAFYPINTPRGRGLLIRVQVLTLWSGIQKNIASKRVWRAKFYPYFGVSGFLRPFFCIVHVYRVVGVSM
jgi:hypothetical protein